MKHLFIYIFTFLLICMGYLSPAFSGEDLFKSEPLSFDVTMTKDEFIEQTTLYEEDPFGDALLAYKVRLPKDWEMVSKANLENVELNSWVLGDITRFVSPPIGESRASFTARALEMKQYMSVDNWFRSFISVQGGFINNIKVFSPNLVHAEYSIFENGKNYFVRAVIQRSVNRVILAEYKVPTKYYNEYMDGIKWSMSLFRMGKNNYDYGDLVKNNNYLKLANHSYPAKWGVRSGKYDTVKKIWYTFGRIKMIRENGYGKMVPEGLKYASGVVKTLLLAKVEFDDLELNIKEIMEKDKEYVFKDKKISYIDRGVGNKESTVGFFASRVYTPKNINDENGLEYWIGINETSSHYFIVYMKIPSRDFHYRLWSENVGAFNLILDTFRPSQ